MTKFVVGGVIEVFDNPKTTLVVKSVPKCNKNLESVYLCKTLEKLLYFSFLPSTFSFHFFYFFDFLSPETIQERHRCGWPNILARVGLSIIELLTPNPTYLLICTWKIHVLILINAFYFETRAYIKF